LVTGGQSRGGNGVEKVKSETSKRMCKKKAGGIMKRMRHVTKRTTKWKKMRYEEFHDTRMRTDKTKILRPGNRRPGETSETQSCHTT